MVIPPGHANFGLPDRDIRLSGVCRCTWIHPHGVTATAARRTAGEPGGRPLLTILGNRAMRTFAGHPALRDW